MKQAYLGLAIATLLAGCVTTEQATTAQEGASIAQAVTAIATGENLIQDPQLTEFRSNSGKSDVWKKNSNKNAGLGDAGSSKDSAFGSEGSSRLRFIAATDDFSAEPGLSQTVIGLQPNTDYQLSLYYNDKKGDQSISQLVYGVTGAIGGTLATKTVHISELADAPQGDVKKGFRQTAINFNSGSNISVTVYANLKITDPSKIDTNGDIGKQTEVRIDEFKLSKM